MEINHGNDDKNGAFPLLDRGVFAFIINTALGYFQH